MTDNFSLQQDVNKKRRKSRKVTKESLVGKCLVHIGESANELYNKAVIYITESTPDMVRGIMINKLLFGTATIECHSKESDSVVRNVYEDLYQGGPENPAHGYVLFPKMTALLMTRLQKCRGILPFLLLLVSCRKS